MLLKQQMISYWKNDFPPRDRFDLRAICKECFALFEMAFYSFIKNITFGALKFTTRKFDHITPVLFDLHGFRLVIVLFLKFFC